MASSIDGGPEEIRTLDFNLARVALSQLSYRPIFIHFLETGSVCFTRKFTA